MQQQLLAALHALYHHDDRKVKDDADKWLEGWQQSVEAWSVADQVLHDPSSSMEAQYFCAQTLKQKVIHTCSLMDLKDDWNDMLTEGGVQCSSHNKIGMMIYSDLCRPHEEFIPDQSTVLTCPPNYTPLLQDLLESMHPPSHTLFIPTLSCTSLNLPSSPTPHRSRGTLRISPTQLWKALGKAF
jgi:hypothetical protein